ncbi:hypothetical protein [Flavobacterium cerinum]|uniref:DUF2971 domain-containing protein n=1 Tax=Flavobacterium cerinum TaxID=2502784 RepID=A0ABY5IS96_9FLAO|nr:hypothetical protein [Flavobacterium cerinum]UUC44417.1 hypothetical protein NOX80_12325 [Flavobacterium cerinum]
MQLYRREFNYSLYYFDSQYEEDDLYHDAKDFGQDKVKDIFKLSLNLYAEIYFLPKIENIDKSWPPYCDCRTIQTAKELYIALLYHKHYQWAGQVKIVEPEIKNTRVQSDSGIPFTYPGIVFFISEEEYENYKEEAKKIAESNDLEEHTEYEVLSQTRTEDLEKYMKLPVFIKEKIIPYFEDSDLYNISRKKAENGTIVFTQTIGNS